MEAEGWKEGQEGQDQLELIDCAAEEMNTTRLELARSQDMGDILKLIYMELAALPRRVRFDTTISTATTDCISLLSRFWKTQLAATFLYMPARRSLNGFLVLFSLECSQLHSDSELPHHEPSVFEVFEPQPVARVLGFRLHCNEVFEGPFPDA